MRLIKLTQGFHAFVDDVDFNHINRHKWFAVVTITGPNGFHIAACRWANEEYPRRLIYMSYAILGIKYIRGNKLIDHRNRNSLDNQKINLRITNKSVNAYNSDRSINASFIYYEKSRDRYKAWLKNIPRSAKTYIGTFKTYKEAELAQNNAMHQLER